MKVALVGAAGTGKTSLARALALALAGSPATTDWQICDDSPLQQRLHAQLQAHPQLDLELSGPLEAPEWVQAMAQQRGFEHTLLLALDVGPANDALRLRMDALLRQALLQAQLPFQVIYGQGEDRLAQALAALQRSPGNSPSKRKPWVWACDTCSDPVCEHRLLSDLLASRLA